LQDTETVSVVLHMWMLAFVLQVASVDNCISSDESVCVYCEHGGLWGPV